MTSIEEKIAKSHMGAMMDLLEDYVIPLIDDIANVLPGANEDTVSIVMDAKRKIEQGRSLLETAYQSIPEEEE